MSSPSGPPSGRRRTTQVPAAAARQAGVFTAAQAIAEGWSERSVRRRRADGVWVRVVGRGLRAASAQPPPPIALAWSAHLTWPDAVVAGPTAAAVRGMPVPRSSTAHVIAGRGRRSRGIDVRVVDLAPEELDVVAGGLLVTSTHRTAVDCLALLPRPAALDLFAWVTTHGVLTRDQLALETRRRLGRHGTPQLLWLLRRTASGAVSGAEIVLHDVLGSAGLYGWEANAPVEDDDGRVVAVADVLFRAARLVVEVDGERAHSGREAFVADRRRQNALVTGGWTVLRFTWWDLVERPTEVVTRIRTILDR